MLSYMVTEIHSELLVRIFSVLERQSKATRMPGT